MELKNKFDNIGGQLRNVYQNTMFVKSIVVGCIGTVVDLSLLYVFTDLMLLNYWISANIAFAITVLVNFSLQKLWTFRSLASTETTLQAFKFFALSLLNIFINSILMYVFVSIFGVWYMLAQAIATALLFLFNFAVYRFYIFV